MLGMFLITQLIGLAVINSYSPITKEVINSTGGKENLTSYNLPFGTEPPSGIAPQTSLLSIIISIAIAVCLMLMLMKFRAERFLRYWFFFVVTLALAITINSFLIGIEYSSLIALIIALPFSIIKVFKRNIIIHNLTELAIYPGIAAIFVPLLNVLAVFVLLILISIYDMYAVWKAGFMQKMAKYQIEKVRIFSGFLIPYLGKKEQAIALKLKNSKGKGKNKKIKVSIALLGGGDVVFPLILAGVVFRALGIFPALIVVIGAALALSTLLLFSKKGKAYPAMPFITLGCLAALALIYLLYGF